MRFDSQFSRMNSQRFSTGFSSGEFGGSGRMLMPTGVVPGLHPSSAAPDAEDVHHQNLHVAKPLIAWQTSRLRQRFRFTAFWEGQRVEISEAAYEFCLRQNTAATIVLIISLVISLEIIANTILTNISIVGLHILKIKLSFTLCLPAQ
jgi:hypothetical protein